MKVLFGQTYGLGKLSLCLVAMGFVWLPGAILCFCAPFCFWGRLWQASGSRKAF